MDNTNPAAAVIDELAETQTPCSHLSKIQNGIRTCGPIVAAALSRDDGELDQDIEEMLNAAQRLINEVKAELSSRKIDISDNESAAINSFCIAVISMNWTHSQEIYLDWVNPIVKSITKPDISSEHTNDFLPSTAGELLAGNIISASEIFISLSSYPGINLSDVFPKAVHEMHQNINKAIAKLSEYHLNPDNADQIRYHLTIQAGKIFKAIVDRECQSHIENQRRSSISNEANTDNLCFSFDEILRNFKVAMDSFVFSIYSNSRINTQ